MLETKDLIDRNCGNTIGTFAYLVRNPKAKARGFEADKNCGGLPLLSTLEKGRSLDGGMKSIFGFVDFPYGAKSTKNRTVLSSSCRS